MASGAAVADQGIIEFPRASSEEGHLRPRPSAVVDSGTRERNQADNQSGVCQDRLRVLVVDDESENTELVARCLRQSYEVDTALSAEQGLELIRSNRYDLIISDQRMPGMSGSQFLAESMEQTPGSIRIIITAYSDMDAAVDAINKADVSAFVRKPFTPNELRDAINRAERVKGVVNEGPERGFRQIVESLSCGVAVVQQGRLRYQNPEWKKVIGDGPAAFQNFVDIFPLSDRKRLAHWVDGDDANTPIVATLPSGAEVSLSSVPLQYEGGSARLVHLHSRTHSKSEAPARPRILLVDDEEPILRSFHRLLRPNYDVVTAANGQEAWEILSRDTDFQLILSDVDMPRMNGINLYKEIAASNPELASKVVLMTGGAGIDGSDVAGHVLCLNKPVMAADITDLLRR
ncbi:MAG: hypothetical protein A2289_24325 [Deltaproteobacteria bacterium RIFOXYA12_FULL_58_15]|nr:MAG: hypothetical protein A2289_24325 [Deltaproteobacteria bacterium RIFOXYA12_FULL_58_15]OGR14175.1 MAG: hypothetical protein A2341_28590 [Deltaproteobacteria bacterium RIFOXYB12_FULL_58_9]